MQLLLDKIPPELGPISLILSLIVGITWFVFPFVVMSHLRGIEDHLKSIRGEVSAPPLDQPECPAPAPRPPA
jgi:hypothetical protein